MTIFAVDVHEFLIVYCVLTEFPSADLQGLPGHTGWVLHHELH